MNTLMKARVLESELQRLSGFDECHRRVALEQYETPAHIAAHALLAAERDHSALCGRIVLDACCGPGVLGAGAALLGASLVLCADVDPAALVSFRHNRDRLADRRPGAADALQPLLCDLTDMTSCALREGAVETVVMNPPFGTKHNAGLDMRLLRSALQLATRHVFSFHKTSTRSHVRRRTVGWGAQAEVVAELRYDLPATYSFHKHNTRDIAVDLWHFTPPSDSRSGQQS